VPPEAAGAAAQRRLRLRYTKTGKVRFTSHRDVARLWERALRRSRLPVAYSQGFVPHPLVSFGLALPTGCESAGEYLDVRLGPAAPHETPVTELPAVLSALLPPGMEVVAAALVDAAEGSLQQEVASCDWEVEVLGVPGEELQERVEKVLAAPILTVRRERKGRQIDDDVRPAILALSVVRPHGHLRARLATHPRGARPADLVAALGAEVVLERACRTHQWIERDGERYEPLPTGGTVAVAAENARRAFPHVRDGNQPDPGGSPPEGSFPGGSVAGGARAG
jgi:radical SAM-linked protein